MSLPNWTKQQSNAINARNANILVSAAAGSGKTAVLVERVKEIIMDIENPINIDQLLIVTFTNAAAAEMKSRIAAKLEDVLKENPNDFNAARQMSLLSCAKICTVDSFCLNLVKDNFFNLGMNQDFSILDQAELNILSDTALDAVLDRFYDENSSAFLQLTDLLSQPKDDKAFVSAIKRIHNYIYAQPFPVKWLFDMAELYNPNVALKDSVWYPYLIEQVKSALEYGKSLVLKCTEFLDPADELFEKYSQNLADDLCIYEKLLKSTENGWNEIILAFKGVRFTRLANKRNYVSPAKDEISSRRDIYKNIVNKELPVLFCAMTEDYTEDMKALYPLLRKLCEVIKAYDAELLAVKHERNGYSFSDIEHFAINLLTDVDENGNVAKSGLAEDLQHNFYEILVDEYQDTNEAQDLIYQMLSNGKNCFMVGDVKQSIYRFRLAMPQIFIEKRNNYDYYDEKNNSDNSKIILDKNFRSREHICKYVNYIFTAFMSEQVGEIDYNKDEFLNYGAQYNNSDIPSAQIKILNNTKGDAFDKNEAIYIAKTILNKIKSGELIKDGENYRPIRYGDFAILLRSVKNHINEYNEVLTSFGIPVIADNSSNLFESNEIKILLSLLRVIDNPMQDIPLLSVMMSPLYGFTAEEMAEIKTENESIKTNLYTSIVNSKSEKVIAFLEEIDMLGKISVTMAVSAFIRYICEYKSVYAFVNALGNGEQRCRNIAKLIDFAAAFDGSDRVGLTAFMRLVDKVEESENGIESAVLNPAAENAVSIMSIHHSKGLEFPVVILAGASRRYNLLDLSDKLLLNSSLGLGLKMHNEEMLYNYNTIPYAVLKEKNKVALISENLRVLYVALTRAKEQFITFITAENIASKISSLSAKISDGKIAPYLCKNIKSDADFILLSALTHQNGKKLRDYADIDIKTVVADFPLDIEMIDTVDEIEETEAAERAEADSEIVSEISKRLSFEYNNLKISSMAAKRTASSLDDSVKGFDYFASSKPAFMNADGMTPSEKGTAMHSFMQYCNYHNAKNDLEGEITRLLNNAYLTEEQAESLSREELSALFSSEFAERMFNADKLYREFKVSSFVKLSDIEDIDSDEEILVQGISDCVFEENGELVIVDYKTDRVKSENQLLSMYENQIAFYKKAVSNALEKNVKEAVLYSFKLGKVCSYK
ncbi:MAG: helicase-exonuclease AddAB subunit AddA [Eubacterium sp.]|nr:helicase-exonuclease AddAB subunit AddA [Eubacterium sp.]